VPSVITAQWTAAGAGTIGATTADRRARTMNAAAAAILLVQCAVRGWAGFRGFFYLDDFAFTGRVARYGLGSHLLLRDYNSHVMPGAFGWVWATTKIWPLQHGPVVAMCLLLQLLIGLVVYRLLIQLFGYRLPVLVLLAVFALTPVTLPAFLWWAAALNQLPQQLAMAVALLWHLRYLRTGRLRWGFAGVGAVGAGLLFSEKTTLAVPLIAGFTYLYAAGGPPLRRLITAWRDHVAIWLGYLVLSVPYTAYYLLAVPKPAHKSFATRDVVDLTSSALAHALGPGLLGGPWRWTPIGFAGGLADPGRVASWLSCAGCLLLIAGTVLASRRAAYAWALLGGYIAADITLLGVSRATVVGSAVGNEYRYFTDVGLVATLVLGLATLPVQSTFRRGTVQRLAPRPQVRRAVARFAGDRLGGTPRPVVRVVTSVVVVFAYAAGSLVSVIGYDRLWHPNPARAYLSTARAELRTAPASLVLFDGVVPQQVAWGLLYPYTRYSLFFAPLADAPHILRADQSTDTLAVLDDAGHLRLAAIAGVSAVPGPKPGCGWRVGSRPTAIPLRAATSDAPGVLRIGYIAPRDGQLSIGAGTTRQTVPVRAGLHAVYLLVRGAGLTITLRGAARTATLCTDEISIGIPVPVVGTRP
jgi:hypothetical protein